MFSGDNNGLDTVIVDTQLCISYPVKCITHLFFINFRYFLETVMAETLSELIQNCTFGILSETVKAEKERKAQLLETILKLVINFLTPLQRLVHAIYRFLSCKN